tara:strand:+ start:213 stop:383 length:171 start_codon:yes stop_codon:yes gene_type:complete
MAFHQSVEGTVAELICHMLKRKDKLNTDAQLAITQEYIYGVSSIRNKDFVPQNIPL